MAITLYENFRALFYTPFYAAVALGHYDKQGLEVRLETSDAPLPIPPPNADGVWWGGPMRCLVGRDQDTDCELVSFCEVVTRDPFFLIGPEPRPAFRMDDLFGCRLGSVSEVPTPWMCLQDDVRRAGLDPDGLSRVSDRSMAENVLAFRERGLDVIQVFEPFATQLLAEGVGHIWYASASRGPTSYTALLANRRTLEARRPELLAMSRAIYAMQSWLHKSEAGAVAAAIQPYFPELDAATLAASIQRYKSLGIWGQNPILPEAGFRRLQSACLSGGLVTKGAAYDDCVDVELTRQAMTG
jgi:NitT/TauT family transport system substrate-binding protein